MADVLAELEHSAEIVLSPSNLVTVERRRAAEEVFLKFRKTKSPYVLCKHILETTKVDYVLYQTSVLLKDAVIREWPLLEKSDVNALKSYLLHYILESTSLQPYVREQMLQVIAIIVKRGGVEGSLSSREEILTEVSRLISSGNMSLQTVGCSILSCILNEYASTIRSSDVGLTWETHFQAKKEFEATDLKRIFQFCIQILCEMERSSVSRELLALLNRFLCIAEQILSWNFIYSNLPRKVVGVFEADQSPFLRPGPTWRDTILDENVIELFFKIHWKIRQQPEIAHHSLNCLIQLASLHGTIFSNIEARIQYLTCFLQGLMKLLISNVVEHEVVGLANVISKLVLFFPSSVMLQLPSDLLNSFFEQFTSFTCRCAQAAAQEEMLHKDIQVYTEGFERLLDAWLSIIRDSQISPNEYCSLSATRVFNTFLQCHLAPPEGTRSDVLEDESEEIDETTEDDRIRYKDQLTIIGMIGRRALEPNILILIRLLESRADTLQERLQEIHQTLGPNSDFTIAAKMLSNLYEDIHWLVLLTGHMLALDNDGETTLIPSEIMQYSIKQAPVVDIDVTLKVLVSPNVRALDIPSCDQSADHIVRLIAVIFRLCEIEKRAVNNYLIHVLSPEVGRTFMWFLSHWALSYLLPNETYYTEMSKALIAAFGHDSQAGNWTVGFLLDKINSNLAAWKSEPLLIEATIQLLVALVESRERCVSMLKCDGLWTILRQQAITNLALLPITAKRNLLKALVLACSAMPDSTSSESLLLEVLKPLQDRMKALVCNENFSRLYHEQSIKDDMIHLLGSFTGVAQGCDMANSQIMFTYLFPILSESVALLHIYHNYQDVVELILEFYCETTKRLLSFLPQVDSQNLYSCCLSMIQTYAKYNIGRHSREASAEEDQYRDILLLMELLTNLLSKDFIDFSPCDFPEGNSVSAADIALLGLNIIMPIMNAELLKFPRLCLQYFKMITFVCEIYPEKICHLPESLLRNLIGSIELAFNNFGTEVVSLCLDFITVLATYMVKTKQQETITYQLVKPFLKIIFDMVLFQTTDFDITITASGTLFALICCYQDYYHELMQVLLASQMDPIFHQRLLTAFNGLLSNISFVEDRPNRLKFRENFEKFIVEVRGFLCVK